MKLHLFVLPMLAAIIQLSACEPDFPLSCKSNGNCPKNAYCHEETCVAANCDIDADCLGGRTCLNNICQTTISGVIIDQAGVVMPGVTVSLNTDRETLTNSRGVFLFGSLEKGSYTIKPLRPGYSVSPESKSLTVNSASVTGVDFQTTAHSLTLVAGVLSGQGNVDGIGSDARFGGPGRYKWDNLQEPGLTDIAVDREGNLYVADRANHTIRKIITLDRKVSTLAGKAGSAGSNDGVGTGARFEFPSAVAVDKDLNVYVADYGNHVIRKITPHNQEVTTLAGASGKPGEDDGVGSTARFKNPSGITVDKDGYIYVADSGNRAVRKIGPSGKVSTFAKNDSFDKLRSLAVDENGNLYVSDYSQEYCCIWKIDATGSVKIFAGKEMGYEDAKGTAAKFKWPSGLAVDKEGNVYVADRNNHLIRQISPEGVVSTLAGKANYSGSINDVGAKARFNKPTGVAVDNKGNVYVADYGNRVIRRIALSSKEVSTIAGKAGGESGAADATGNNARFYSPESLDLDSTGNIYVADTHNYTIRKIEPDGKVSTIAGSARTPGVSDGPGSTALFKSIYDISLDASGNIYAASHHTIRKITFAGDVNNVITFAGNSGDNGDQKDDGSGSTDGLIEEARFNITSGVDLDNAGNIYVADHRNHTIRKITPEGIVSTLAGKAGVPGNSDGIGTAASFNYPRSLVVDSSGYLYVTDRDNHTIRKISPQGEVSTLAGKANEKGNADGAGPNARFDTPIGITTDGSGNLYVADSENHTIRMITPLGTVSTIVGIAGHAANTLGPLPASLSYPLGVRVDPQARNLYITLKDAVLQLEL